MMQASGFTHWMYPQFVKSVEDMVGPGRTSYMSFFPFTMPISAFGRMRSHIAHHLNAMDFNHALAMWSDLPGVDMRGGGMNGAVFPILQLWERTWRCTRKTPSMHLHVRIRGTTVPRNARNRYHPAHTLDGAPVRIWGPVQGVHAFTIIKALHCFRDTRVNSARRSSIRLSSFQWVESVSSIVSIQDNA